MLSATVTIGTVLIPRSQEVSLTIAGMGLLPLHQAKHSEPRGFVSGWFLSTGTLWSHQPLWTGVDFGCSLLSVAGNVVAGRLQASASRLVDYCVWRYSAGAVVFPDLVELASLCEIT